MTQRATWVWQPSVDAVAFASAVGAQELFVHVPLDLDRLPDERAAIVRVVDAAHAAGLRVAALGGDAGWLDHPDDVVHRWLAPALQAAHFDGIHLDVEPAIDPDHPDPVLVGRFLALLRRMAGARPHDVPVDLDVRFWYWRVPAGRTDLQSALLMIVDAVTVMSYRTATVGADGSIAITRPTAERAAHAGKTFRVAQETRHLGDDPVDRKQTFFGKRRADLHAASPRSTPRSAGPRATRARPSTTGSAGAPCRDAVHH